MAATHDQPCSMGKKALRLTPASTLVISSTRIPDNGSLSTSLENARCHDLWREARKAVRPTLPNGRIAFLVTDIVLQNSYPSS